jgi:hypothetical protein
VTVWNQNPDIILIGSLRPHNPEFELLSRRMQLSDVSADLTHPLIEGRIHDPLEFLAGQMMSDRVFKTHFPGSGRLNSDYRPYVEFAAARDFFTGGSPLSFYRLDERLLPRKNNHLYIADYLGEKKLSGVMLSKLIDMFSGRTGKSEIWLSEILIYQYLEGGNAPGAAGLNKILQHGNHSWLASRQLWENRLDSGNLSTDEREDYQNFRFRMRVETASVFADPGR